jgi:hypothetical protein
VHPSPIVVFDGISGEGEVVGCAGFGAQPYGSVRILRDLEWLASLGDGGDALAGGWGDGVGLGEGGAECGLGGAALFPGEVQFQAGAGGEAAKAAVRPGFGQGGEEADDAGVGLEQHLDEAGGSAEVAVDLEGRVFLEAADVEEIVAGGLAEELEDIGVGGVAVAQAGHAVDDPGARPAGAASAGGEAGVERGAGGAGQRGRGCWRDLIFGEETRRGERCGDGLVLRRESPRAIPGGGRRG